MRVSLLRILLVLCSLTFLLTPAFGDTITFGFGTTAGDKTTIYTQTVGSTTVTATAYNGGDVWIKKDGGDENGLGMSGDPTGNHEIWNQTSPGVFANPQPFIQLNLSNMISAGYTNIQFWMASTTSGESWAVYACSVAGDKTSCGTAVTGSNEGSGNLHALPSNFGAGNPYVLVFDTSANGTGGANVLLSGLSYKRPAVPEPASMTLLGSGLVALGGFLRRRGKKRS